jgi:hypothetical protein
MKKKLFIENSNSTINKVNYWNKVKEIFSYDSWDEIYLWNGNECQSYLTPCSIDSSTMILEKLIESHTLVKGKKCLNYLLAKIHNDPLMQDITIVIYFGKVEDYNDYNIINYWSKCRGVQNLDLYIIGKEDNINIVNILARFADPTCMRVIMNQKIKENIRELDQYVNYILDYNRFLSQYKNQLKLIHNYCAVISKYRHPNLIKRVVERIQQKKKKYQKLLEKCNKSLIEYIENCMIRSKESSEIDNKISIFSKLSSSINSYGLYLTLCDDLSDIINNNHEINSSKNYRENDTEIFEEFDHKSNIFREWKKKDLQCFILPLNREKSSINNPLSYNFNTNLNNACLSNTNELKDNDLRFVLILDDDECTSSDYTDYINICFKIYLKAESVSQCNLLFAKLAYDCKDNDRFLNYYIFIEKQLKKRFDNKSFYVPLPFKGINDRYLPRAEYSKCLWFLNYNFLLREKLADLDKDSIYTNAKNSLMTRVIGSHPVIVWLFERLYNIFFENNLIFYMKDLSLFNHITTLVDSFDQEEMENLIVELRSLVMNNININLLNGHGRYKKYIKMSIPIYDDRQMFLDGVYTFYNLVTTRKRVAFIAPIALSKTGRFNYFNKEENERNRNVTINKLIKFDPLLSPENVWSKFYNRDSHNIIYPNKIEIGETRKIQTFYYDSQWKEKMASVYEKGFVLSLFRDGFKILKEGRLGYNYFIYNIFKRYQRRPKLSYVEDGNVLLVDNPFLDKRLSFYLPPVNYEKIYNFLIKTYF